MNRTYAHAGRLYVEIDGGRVEVEELLALASAGFTPAEIAADLPGLSPTTILGLIEADRQLGAAFPRSSMALAA